jgi:hypothetical protein
MSRAHNLYKRLSMEQLHAKRQALIADPANRNPDRDSIYLYTPKARRMLDDIAWAVSYHMSDEKKAEAVVVSEALMRGMDSTMGALA